MLHVPSSLPPLVISLPPFPCPPPPSGVLLGKAKLEKTLPWNLWAEKRHANCCVVSFSVLDFVGCQARFDSDYQGPPMHVRAAYWHYMAGSSLWCMHCGKLPLRTRRIPMNFIMWLDSVVDLFRQYADVCTKFLDRVFLFAFGFNWIYYKGRPAKAKDAPIMIMAPHSSFLDVFVVSLYGAPTFVARDDMRNIRLFGCKSVCLGLHLNEHGEAYGLFSTICFNVHLWCTQPINFLIIM